MVDIDDVVLCQVGFYVKTTVESWILVVLDTSVSSRFTLLFYKLLPKLAST